MNSMKTRVLIRVCTIFLISGNLLFAQNKDLKDYVYESGIYQNKSLCQGIVSNIYAAICQGDTSAYNALMLQVPYYDYFVYSLYMANEYNYAPAYYNAYRIYHLWLKMYDKTINIEQLEKLTFWLEWGKSAGNEACRILLNERAVSDLQYALLDSLNNFNFILPFNNTDNDSIYATDFEWTTKWTTKGEIGYTTEIKIAMHKDQFEQHKDLRLENDSISHSILERYAFRGQTDSFTKNENLLFRIHEQLNYKQHNKQLTWNLLFYLNNHYNMCEDMGNPNTSMLGYCFFCSRLGRYLLQIAYSNGDEYAVWELARIYAQGCGVEQDYSKAYEILRSNVSELAAKNAIAGWTKNAYWLNTNKKCRCNFGRYISPTSVRVFNVEPISINNKLKR